MVTLTSGVRVDARGVLGWLLTFDRLAASAHPALHQSLTAVAGGRTADADPALVQRFRALDLLTPDDRLKADVAAVFSAACDLTPAGEFRVRRLAEVFAPASYEERINLYRLQSQLEQREAKLLNEFLGQPDDGTPPRPR